MSLYQKALDRWKESVDCCFVKIDNQIRTTQKTYIKVLGRWRTICETEAADGALEENMIVFFTSTPDGWKVLNGVDATPDLTTNSVYLRGDTEQGDSEAGSNTHSAPTYTGSSGNPTTQLVYYTDIIYQNVEKLHTHTINHTHVAINSEPPYYSLIPCKGGNSILTTTVLFMDGSVPAGWSSVFGIVGDKFVKCGATGGGTGGNATHSHDYSGYSGYANISVNTIWHSGTGILRAISHRHTINHTHDAVSNYPEWYGLIPISPDSEVTEIPSGVVAFFTGSDVPDGWTLFGAMSGGKFIRLQATSGETGGVNDHTHSYSGSSGSYDGVNHQTTGTSNPFYCVDPHSHTINHTHSTADNIPLHRSMLVCKKD